LRILVFFTGSTGCFSTLKTKGEKGTSNPIDSEDSSLCTGSTGYFSILPLIPVHLLLEPQILRQRVLWIAEIYNHPPESGQGFLAALWWMIVYLHGV